MVLRVKARRTDRRRPDRFDVVREVWLAGGATACMAVATLLGAESSTQTTGTIFWPLLFLLLSARRPARSTTEFSFCQCCISKRLGRDISVLAFAFSYTYCWVLHCVYHVSSQSCLLTSSSCGLLDQADTCRIGNPDCQPLRPQDFKLRATHVVVIELPVALDVLLDLLILVYIGISIIRHRLDHDIPQELSHIVRAALVSSGSSTFL